MIYKGMDLEYMKAVLGEDYTEQDVMLVADAMYRTKNIGAKKIEQTVCLMEKEIRELRNKITKYESSQVENNVQTETLEVPEKKIIVTIDIETM